MVTPAELESWQPSSLTDIAESILSHRRTLTALDDDLLDGRPPASWTFADGDAARTTHDTLTAALATQVSETTGVIDALDAAAAAITTAKSSLAGAKSTARSYGMTVDPTTGAVRSTRTYEDDAERADARLVQQDLAAQITSALTDAQAADDALAAALTTASTTDTNTLGTLTQQRQLAEFEAKTPAEQVQYLLDHPEAYAFLGEHVSPEVKAQLGEEIGAGLDGVARDATGFNDLATVQRYTELLGAFGDDPAVMGPMYERLGPDGLLGAYNGMTGMMYVGSNVEELGTLAGELRAGLQAATQHAGFDGRTFGEDLVRYATYTTGDDARDAFASDYPSGGEHAAVLDYLLRDGEYGEDFVRGVAWELDEFERAEPLRAQTWTHHASFASPLNGLGTGTDGIYQPDPMAATMGQLGRHPGLGLEFFSDSDGEKRSAYYFAERDWSRDGFAGISEAALAIGTDPENIANDSAKTGMFVSEFFDRLPDNPEFTAENAAGAAEPVANLLKHYMPSVDAAVGSSEAGDHGARIRDFTTNEYLGALLDQPVLDRSDLDGLLTVALSSEDGMARIAEGVAGLRQTQLTNFALQHPGPDGARENVAGLQSILNSSSRVEGFMQHAVGEIEIDGARSADQRVAAFTGLVSEAAGLLPVPFADQAGDAVGDLGKKVWETAWGHVQEIPSDRITESFGSNEDAARSEQTGEAQLGRENMVIGTFLSLTEAGVLGIPESMRDTWAPDGRLISLGDIPPEDVQTFRSEAADALGTVLSVSELELTYKDPFTGWFDK
jgi:hypothetical protein